MSGTFYTPGVAATDPIFAWWTPFAGLQHAFRGDRAFRSVCDAARWSVKLERDPEAPICPDCRRIVWDLTGAARDYIVDQEARADHHDTQFRIDRLADGLRGDTGPLRENAITEPELIAGYGGLPSER